MALAAGTRLGRFEILAPLGAGGMGEVYRARDTRLDRSVALKVLSARHAVSTDGRERFEREARAISSLSHPHICTLYDVGQQDGIDYLVMEILEGETLASRLERGPLPLGTLVEHASQIVDALDRAHGQRLVHRDLKPANVMLTRSGAKLLDFGLARTMTDASPLSVEETADQPLTGAGRILGTYPYMSPEQLRGKPADSRSDIFAFGAVLYEMATGERAFPGESAAAMAAILEREPAGLGKLQPPELERLVRGCLEKDPEARWQSARDVKRMLGWLREAATAEAPPVAPRRRQSRLAWAVAAASLLLALSSFALHWSSRGSTPGPRGMLRSSMLPPPHHSFAPSDFALSPDGTRVALVTLAPAGERSLWVRSLDGRSQQELKQTEDASSPFWAPDGRRIGFFARGKLKLVDTGSGSVQVLAEAPEARGGTWNREGAIVFCRDRSSVLTISDRGGATKPIATSDPATERTTGYPQFLPDGRHFLYLVSRRAPGTPWRDGLYMGSLDASAPKLVSEEIDWTFRHASGQLLYVRDGSLMSRAFDPARRELGGPAVALFERELRPTSGVSVSENGVLLFEAVADAASELVWYDRAGREVGRLASEGLRDPSLSPDGRLLAAVSEDGGTELIRVVDLQRGVSTPVTEPGRAGYPTWSPDGTRIAFQSGVGADATISQVAADGSAPPEVLLEGGWILPTAYTADGRSLLYMTYGGRVDEIALLDLASRHSSDLVAGAEGALSPDGRWLAYNSVPREGRDLHVFVKPLSGQGPQVQISREGGAQPRWSRDGTRLFFVAPDRKLMEAEMDVQGERLAPRAPKALFQTRIVGAEYVLYQYDVTRDASRFLVNSLKAGTPLTLVSDWTSALRR
jgi:serine/threonine protein kinase